MIRIHIRRVGVAAVAVVAGTALVASSAFATGHPATGFGPVGPRAVVKKGETFYKATVYNVSFNAGETMTWSGNADGTGTTFVDDVAVIQVKHQDGSKSKLTIDYTSGCTVGAAIPPKDITSLFRPGLNAVTVTFKDKCGGEVWAPQQYFIS
jgi:hypothetical protein